MIVPDFIKIDKLWIHLFNEEHITNKLINNWTSNINFKIAVGGTHIRGTYRNKRKGRTTATNCVISVPKMFRMKAVFHDFVKGRNWNGFNYFYPAHMKYRDLELIGTTTLEDVEDFMVVAVLSVEAVIVTS